MWYNIFVTVLVTACTISHVILFYQRVGFYCKILIYLLVLTLVVKYTYYFLNVRYMRVDKVVLRRQ